MKYAVLNSGVLTGIVYEFLNDYILAHHKAKGEIVIKVWGLRYSGTREEPVWEEIPEAEAPSPVIITMRQARMAIQRAGRLPEIIAHIEQLPETEREELKIEWEYSKEIERDSLIATTIMNALNLTEAQMDNVFKTAAMI